MHLAECREFLENSLAHDRRTQVAKLATFTAILVAKNVFLLAIATKMVTAWSNYYKVLYVLFSFCFNFESSNWLCSQGKPSPWHLGKALPSFPLYYSNYALLCLDCECFSLIFRWVIQCFLCLAMVREDSYLFPSHCLEVNVMTTIQWVCTESFLLL